MDPVGSADGHSIDGTPPKRRGPKPDSKPALTRRQELNRQAQRTHRERKELYIKALEDEVLRLKEIYSNISQDKERLADENRQLKQLLSQNGMPAMTGALSGGGSGSLLDDAVSNPSVGYSGSASGSASYAPAPSSQTSAFTPPPGAHSAASPPQQQQQPPPLQQQQGNSHRHGHSHSHGQVPPVGQQRNPGIDYDQAGIDFVLTYDHPSKASVSPPRI